MPGFGAIGRFPIAVVVQPAAAEFIDPGKYMQALSEPQRRKAGLLAAAQSFFFMDPQPFVPFDWREPLSEPQRQKPRSPAALAPAFFFEPAPSPFVATGWFSALSEPQRPIKMRTALYPAWTGPTQLRPTPTIFAVMNAIEQFDTFLAGATEFSAVDGAEVNLIVQRFSGAEPGVARIPITGARVSIRLT
jgi:hypothetical protein